VHSYFAGMGGFAVQLEDNYNFFPCKSFGSNERIERLTLTAEGLLYLDKTLNQDASVQGSIIPNLGLKHIEDKSNASIFAKSLVCFQGQYCHIVRPLCLSFSTV